MSSEDCDPKAGKIVLFVDGCFDMFHYGHANAIRRAKKLFPNAYLICGVHDDEDIAHNKGPTVMKSQERYDAVRACRWVDEVAEGAPFVCSAQVLKELGVHHCVHGEDISTAADGSNAYQEVIDAGLYMTIPRTRGVSTTNLVNRLLDAGRWIVGNDKDEGGSVVAEELKRRYSSSQRVPIRPDEERAFFPSALRIREFADDLRVPDYENDRIIYVDGTFDLFHVGHVEFLKQAKARGTYLVVGVHNDDTVAFLKGSRFPLLSVHERVLSVLACGHVDDVVIGAPFAITEQMVRAYGIHEVVVGSTFDLPSAAEREHVDPYAVPKKMGILHTIPSPRPDLTITAILHRIGGNVETYLKRQGGRRSEEAIFDDIEASKKGLTEQQE